MELGIILGVLVIGLALGAVIGVLFERGRSGKEKADDPALAQATDRFNEANARIGGLTEAVRLLTEERDRLRNETVQRADEVTALNARLASSIEKFKNQEERINTQKQEIEELHKRLNTEFENLANRILDEKSKKFTDQNKVNLDQILTPLRERIKDFEEKVERSYGEEKKDKAELRGEIKKLMELNQQISTEANNLTTALRGDAKKQGNWGEVILERIMESSGLEKGTQYQVQYSTTAEDGSRLMPDVVVMLPEGKHIIIDSKVSLVAYDRMVNADTEEEQIRQMALHVQSVKAHIKGLSEKNYPGAKGLNSPDFVLLFMPIESSFSQAIKADDELFNFAWERNIVIVGPSTLLATLRTISAIWRQEQQSRNALLIAEKGAAMYDKFVGFVEDLKRIGKNIEGTQRSYDEAFKKLSEGSGNLVRRAEEMRKLGAKGSKQLPQDIFGDDDEA